MGFPTEDDVTRGYVLFFDEWALATGDVELEKILNKFWNKVDKLYDIGMKTNINAAEKGAISLSKAGVEQQVSTWKGVTAYILSIDEIAKEFDLTHEEKMKLLNALIRYREKVEGDIGDYYSKYKGLKEFGWDMHQGRFRYIMYFIPVLAMFLIGRTR